MPPRPGSNLAQSLRCDCWDGRCLQTSLKPLADHWIDELDRCHVDHAALIASIVGDEDSVIAAVRRSPGRLVGYFMLNPLLPDAM